MGSPIQTSGSTIINDRRNILYGFGFVTPLFSKQYLKNQDSRNVVALSVALREENMLIYWAGEAISNHIFSEDNKIYKNFEILGIGNSREIKEVITKLENKTLMNEKDSQWNFNYGFYEDHKSLMGGVELERSVIITPKISFEKFRKKPSIIDVGFSTSKNLEESLKRPTYISLPSSQVIEVDI